VIAEVGQRPEFAEHLAGLSPMWNFASPEATERRLAAAGFEAIACSLEPKPVTPERPLEFTSTVTLGPMLAMMPEEKRRPFAEAILEASEQPLTLDYVRLNIQATRPGA